VKKVLTIIVLLMLATTVQAQSRILSECRQIADVNARVACYDEIVDAAQLRVDEETSTAVSQPLTATEQQSRQQAITAQDDIDSQADLEAAQPAQAAETTGATEESLFGQAAEASRRILQEDLGVQQLEQIEASVSTVSTSAFGKLVVQLSNGQTWQQIDSSRLQLRQGDAVIIRSGRLGAYFLEKSSGSRSLRVRRVL
jgi:hypothetical protein